LETLNYLGKVKNKRLVLENSSGSQGEERGYMKKNSLFENQRGHKSSAVCPILQVH